MNELQALLDKLANTAEVSDEELAELKSELTTHYNELKASGISAETVEAMASIVDAIDGIKVETASRKELAQELARKAEELDARLSDEDEDEDEDATDAEDEDVDADAEDTDTEDAGDVLDATDAPAADVADATPALAASAKGTPAPAKRAALGEIKRRQRKESKPKPKADVPIRVFAAADVPGIPANAEISDRRTMAEALIRRHEAFRGSRQGVTEKVTVMTAKAEFPDDRKVSSRNSAFSNTDIFKSVVSDDAIVAAGGICAPTTPRYELAMISQASRPVRDSLPSFNADRGGINWLTPPRLSDIGTSGGSPDQAIDQITEAEDAANATKPYQRVDCGTPQELQIYAVTNILEFGNLLERTYPEQVETWTDLSFAAHARYAENLLLAAIGTASTAVTTGIDVGSARDLLNYYNLAAVAYRNRHRMRRDATLRLYIPFWVVALYQNDLTNAAYSLHGEAGDIDEAKIRALYRRRNIEVTFFDDGEAVSGANQIFGSQSTGLLNGFPNRVRAYLFHEGAFVLLDGGTLDLGVVRDSTLNASNVFRTFVETFEAVAFVGIESLQITSDICASGISAGTVNSTLCDGGS